MLKRSNRIWKGKTGREASNRFVHFAQFQLFSTVQFQLCISFLHWAGSTFLHCAISTLTHRQFQCISHAREPPVVAAQVQLGQTNMPKIPSQIGIVYLVFPLDIFYLVFGIMCLVFRMVYRVFRMVYLVLGKCRFCRQRWFSWQKLHLREARWRSVKKKSQTNKS